MVLQLLAAFIRAVQLVHRNGPDSARDPANHGVLRIHAVREEEAQVRCESVHVHAARPVVLDQRETICQCEGQLADRIRTRLGDVVTAHRYGVVVANLVLDEPGLDVAHHSQGKLERKNARVLRLVLLQYVGLNRSSHDAQCLNPDRFVFGCIGLPAFPLDKCVHLLVDGGVQEHRQQDRSRSVDGH